MPTVEELVLSIQSEGIGEARDGLEGIEQSMEETAEQAGDSAEELGDWTASIKGALSAAVAAMAVGLSGLVSMVPVFGEIFSGVVAVISALGFQIDQLARQLGAGRITEALFNFSSFIFGLEGAMGDLAAIIGVVTTALLSAALGAAAWLVKVKGLFGALSAIGGAIKAAVVAIAGFISSIGLVPAAIAAAVAAVVAFAAAYALNLGGVRDKTNKILGQVWGFFTSLGSDLAEWATGIASDAWDWGTGIINGLLNGLDSLLDTLIGGFLELGQSLANWAANLAETAYEWGVGIIESIIAGIESMAQSLLNTLVSVLNSLVGKINTILDKLPDIVTSRIAVESFETFDPVDVGGSASAPEFDFGGGGGGLAGASGAFSTQSRGRTLTTIDGRQLSESTGRYRSDPARRRGL